MYCIRCGVELQKGAEKCPLCSLTVYHPLLESELSIEKDAPYPPREEIEHVSRHGALFITTFLTAVPLLISIMLDLRFNERIVWSGYVAVGLLALYVIICLPLWFRRPNPVIFFPVAAAALEVVALYVSLKTETHFFLSFALPVGGALLLIAQSVLTLMYYVKKGEFFIFGGAFIALGLTTVLIEFLIKVTFQVPMIWWSLYPLSGLFLIGMMLIIIGTSRHLRESLHKKFFM